MEGIAMNLGAGLQVLKGFISLSDGLVIVGGGSKSEFWRQIFADVFEMKVNKTNIGEDAGFLGAAAMAAVGSGLWNDFSKMDQLHQVESELKPIPENTVKCRHLDSLDEVRRQGQAERQFSCQS